MEFWRILIYKSIVYSNEGLALILVIVMFTALTPLFLLASDSRDTYPPFYGVTYEVKVPNMLM